MVDFPASHSFSVVFEKVHFGRGASSHPNIHHLWVGYNYPFINHLLTSWDIQVLSNYLWHEAPQKRTYHCWHWMFNPVDDERWPEIYHGGTKTCFFSRFFPPNIEGLNPPNWWHPEMCQSVANVCAIFLLHFPKYWPVFNPQPSFTHSILYETILSRKNWHIHTYPTEREKEKHFENAFKTGLLSQSTMK